MAPAAAQIVLEKLRLQQLAHQQQERLACANRNKSAAAAAAAAAIAPATPAPRKPAVSDNIVRNTPAAPSPSSAFASIDELIRLARENIARVRHRQGDTTLICSYSALICRIMLMT